MSKRLGTVWRLEPHTKKKHDLLRFYFEAWLPIVGRFSKRVVYIDGFAGPGVYENGEDGSPAVVLKAARDHTFPTTAELLCVFVEAEPKRFDSLKTVIDTIAKTLPSNIKAEAIFGRFDEHLQQATQLLTSQRNQNAPTLAFIDPFGFSHTPFEAVKQILSVPKCEVFINFMYEEVNRFLTKAEHAEDYDSLFGTTKWRHSDRAGDARTRRRALHDLYEAQLRKVAKFVHSFEMKNAGNSTDFFLFFATNHLLGLEKMKEAMWKADPSGAFVFSDFVESKGQASLFGNLREYPELRAQMLSTYAGRTVMIQELSDWVVASTDFLRTHLKTPVLVPLEQEGLISAELPNGKRRRGTFPDGTRITFK